MDLNGTFQVRKLGTGDNIVAYVKLVDDGAGVTIYARYDTSEEWVEDPDAYGYLMGDFGAVERISS